MRIRRHCAHRAALGVGGQDGKHLTGVKMFSLITAFYLVGYVPFGLMRTRFAPYEVGFLYFVNHFCNPLIYIIVNKRFRRDVIDVIANIRMQVFKN